MASVTNKHLKIYVAGAYLAVPKPLKVREVGYTQQAPDEIYNRDQFHKCVRETALNTERAIRTGIEIMKMGHLVFVPHLSHYIHQFSNVEFDNEYWYDFDNQWLDLCDGLYIVGTAGVNGTISKGTIAEIARAEKNGIPVYRKLDDIPRFSK